LLRAGDEKRAVGRILNRESVDEPLIGDRCGPARQGDAQSNATSFFDRLALWLRTDHNRIRNRCVNINKIDLIVIRSRLGIGPACDSQLPIAHYASDAKICPVVVKTTGSAGGDGVR